MDGIIYSLILIADVVAIVDCIRSKKNNGKKILWSFLIILMPIVGVIFYFLVGKYQT